VKQQKRPAGIVGMAKGKAVGRECGIGIKAVGRECGDGKMRTEKDIAERWHNFPTDPTYPRGGRCGTGRCGDCDWCDFLETFTAERVLELLAAEESRAVVLHHLRATVPRIDSACFAAGDTVGQHADKFNAARLDICKAIDAAGGCGTTTAKERQERHDLEQAQQAWLTSRSDAELLEVACAMLPDAASVSAIPRARPPLVGWILSQGMEKIPAALVDRINARMS
jgi:hypothetical protein